MVAEVATIVSDIRYLTAAGVTPEVPDEYLPARYGPQRDGDSSEQPTVDRATEIDRDARARAGAAEIRAEMGI